jgi:hypothetical protein
MTTLQIMLLASQKGGSKMKTLLDSCYGALRLVPLLGLEDPVRPLPRAIEEIATKLRMEFNDPLTSSRRREEILERFALLRSVLGPACIHAGTARLHTC